jgi:hypothetical protein
MSTLLDSARVTLSPGAFWKSCRRCAGLFPGAPDQLCCRDCEPCGPAVLPAWCSCGRRPIQWLDGPRGSRTVPYCGFPLRRHHGLEREAATWEPRRPRPAAGGGR